MAIPSFDKAILWLDGIDTRFTVTRHVVLQSSILRDLLTESTYEEENGYPVVPIGLNCTEKQFREVLTWLERQPAVDETDDTPDQPQDFTKTTIGAADQEFLGNEDNFPNVYAYVHIGEYLDLKPLLIICQKHLANHMRGLTPNQIRAKFQLPDDLTDEQKREITAQNEWVEG